MCPVCFWYPVCDSCEWQGDLNLLLFCFYDRTPGWTHLQEQGVSFGFWFQGDKNSFRQSGDMAASGRYGGRRKKVREKQREWTGSRWEFLMLKSHQKWHTSSSKDTPLKLPKHLHHLGTKYSKAQDYKGHLPFRQSQCSIPSSCLASTHIHSDCLHPLR